MSTPAPLLTCIFTLAGLRLKSVGIGIYSVHFAAPGRPGMQAHASPLVLIGCTAAGAGRNRIAVRASFWMAEKGADALVKFRRDDVFEAASLLVRFGIFNGKGVGEQAFGQTVAANYVAGAASTGFGKPDFAAGGARDRVSIAVTVAHRQQIYEPGIRHAPEESRRARVTKNR